MTNSSRKANFTSDLQEGAYKNKKEIKRKDKIILSFPYRFLEKRKGEKGYKVQIIADKQTTRGTFSTKVVSQQNYYSLRQTY